MKTYFSLVLLGCVMLVHYGCLNLKQEVPQFKYFALEYAPPRAKTTGKLGISIRVGRFQANTLYGTDRIIIHARPFEHRYYTFERWVIEPGQMVSELIARDLETAKVFKSIQYGRPVCCFDFEIRGNIRKIAETVEAGQRRAVLEIRSLLVKNNRAAFDEQVIFDKVYVSQKRILEEGAIGLVNAMSKAMQEISEKLINDVYLALRAEKR